jgi:site-specific DNA recombinase
MKEPAIQFNRISSDSQDDGFSLEAQEQLGKEYAKKHNLRVVKVWSEVESAYKEQDRKKFFQMVEFVKKEGVKHVIFDKVDRAVRGFRSAVVVEDLVEEYGVRFHFTREGLIIDSTSSPQDKFRFYLFAIMGKYYVDNLKQEQKKGVNQRLENGHWSWKCPIGYSYGLDPANRRKIVVPDPKVAPAIKQIFAKYSTGNYSLPNLIPMLNAVADKEYSWKVLGGLIENPFYYGVMRVKGRIMAAAHEGIIDKKTWDACQKIRGIRAEQQERDPAKKNIAKPFMGLIRCGECGHAITGETKRKPNGRTYIYYRCSESKCSQETRFPRQPAPADRAGFQAVREIHAGSDKRVHQDDRAAP